MKHKARKLRAGLYSYRGHTIERVIHPCNFVQWTIHPPLSDAHLIKWGFSLEHAKELLDRDISSIW